MSSLDLGGGGAAAPSGDEPAVKTPSTFVTGSKSPLTKMGNRLGGRRLKPARADGKDVTQKDALCIIVMGEKDSGKTVNLMSIPAEGRKVLITFDNTARMSMESRFGPEVFNEWEVYDMTRPVVDGDTVVYPGFDLDKPATAEHVLGELSLILEEMEQDGDVGLLVIDHFQALYEQVAKSYAHHKANVEPGGKLKLEDWQHRTYSMEHLEAKIRRVPRAGEEPKAIISGYAPEFKEKYAKVKDETGKEKTVVVTEMTTPKWLKDNIRRNWHALLYLFTFSNDEDPNSPLGGVVDTTYMTQVMMSKAKRFTKGEKRNVTDVGLGAFWGKSATEELEELASA